MLVAGVGNLLRADDAFGVEVAHRLMEMDLPDGVKVVETGIGGIALVQELQEGYDALVVIDAVDRGRPPGHVMLILLDVPDVDDMEWGERYDFLADVHLATPERALIMSKALGVLPENTADGRLPAGRRRDARHPHVARGHRRVRRGRRGGPPPRRRAAGSRSRRKES